MDLVQAAVWHRQVAALALAAGRAGVTPDALAMVHRRLEAQRAAFLRAAAGSGQPLPALEPTPNEVAGAGMAGPTPATAIQTMLSTLDQIDAALGWSPGHPGSTTLRMPGPTPPATGGPGPAGPGGMGAPVGPGGLGAPVGPGGPGAGSLAQRSVGWPVPVRNGLVYGAYAGCVFFIQIVLLLTQDEERTLPLLAPFCLLVFPAFAWLGGYLTVRAMFRPDPGAQGPGAQGPGGQGPGAPPPVGLGGLRLGGLRLGGLRPGGPRLGWLGGVGPGQPNRVNATPRLGAAICLAPDLLLCVGIGVLFLTRS